MFDVLKDIDRYKGVPPYASEHYGVYQPLLGWASKLTKAWISRGGPLLDPTVKRVLDGRLTPGPSDVRGDDPREFVAEPLQPATGKSPFKVLLTKNLGSEVLNHVQATIQGFVERSDGRLPENAEWNQLIEVNFFLDEENGPLRKANDIHRGRLLQEMVAQAMGKPFTEEMREVARAKHLELMQFESQIATFLLAQAEGQDGADQNGLAKLFSVRSAPFLSEILRPTDPLANIDPLDRSGALSPVGFVHLFRQYYFDLGTFLGEPVEHIWLAPGTTIELIEVSARKTIVERAEETASETTSRTEHGSEVKDELSEAVRSENSNSTKIGISTTQAVNYGVYQGSATASFGTESARKEARESTHKQNREQSEKLSSEIKQSFKSVFRTVTETTDTRSRRYILQNPGTDLINYELRRKMRRVGVQMQDLGIQLCWQVFIDDAGATLGLADLVHFAQSPDLANLKEPEIGPPPGPIAKKVTLPIPFAPIRTNDNNAVDYAFTNLQGLGKPWAGKYLGNRSNTDDEDAQDYMTIMGPFHFKFDPPQSNYVRTEDIRVLGPQGNKQAIVRRVENVNSDGSFDIVMDFLNYGGENSLGLDVELVFKPLPLAKTEYEAAKKKAEDKYDADRQRLLKKSFLEEVRARVKDASNIKARPSWDLREEERTVIYRKLIERLMLGSWEMTTNNPKDGSNARVSHVRSEVVRAIFDVDAMLYFVAPEWWMPRKHSHLNLDVDVGDAPMHLTDDDVVKWSDVEPRLDNYKITENSAPARLGSSLGWLLQLDGDNLRNAFLNAPWVKAIIPIRPGREKAALNWLRSIEGHENDGWESEYLGTGQGDEEFQDKTIGEVLEIVADRMAAQNGDIQNVLKADEVFEKGFDHLAGGFDAGLPANEVFSQWISVLPTDQIVAAKYNPTDLET